MSLQKVYLKDIYKETSIMASEVIPIQNGCLHGAFRINDTHVCGLEKVRPGNDCALFERQHVGVFVKDGRLFIFDCLIGASYPKVVVPSSAGRNLVLSWTNILMSIFMIFCLVNFF